MTFILLSNSVLCEKMLRVALCYFLFSSTFSSSSSSSSVIVIVIIIIII